MRRQGLLTEKTENFYIMSSEEAERSIRESFETQLSRIAVPGKISNVTVICDPNYVHEMMSYYHWSERNAANYLENGSFISGQVFHSEKELVIVPRFLLPIVSEQRSRTGVKASVENAQGAEYSNRIFFDSLQQTDYNWMQSFGPLRIVGYCHSHPDLGAIGVKPSSIDVTDHAESMSDGRLIWLSQIVDPIRRLSAFYFGKNMKTPNVVLYLYPSDADLFRCSEPYKRQTPETLPEHIRKVFRNEALPKGSPAEGSEEALSDTAEITTETPAENIPGNGSKKTQAKTVKTKRSKNARRKKKAFKIELKKTIKKCLCADDVLEALAQVVISRTENK